MGIIEKLLMRVIGDVGQMFMGHYERQKRVDECLIEIWAASGNLYRYWVEVRGRRWGLQARRSEFEGNWLDGVDP